VKLPFSWPKISLSMRLSGIAVMLMAANSFCARGLNLWMAPATSSLPQPLSPVIITGASERETRPMSLKTSCIAGERPMMVSWMDSAGTPAAWERVVLRASMALSAFSTTLRSS